MLSPEFTLGVSAEEAFKRDPSSNDQASLVYPNLVTKATEAEQKENQLWREFNATSEGSIIEEDRARALARGYLVLTSLQLQRTKPENQEAVSDRFTTATTELSGTPDENEVKRILNVKINEFTGYKTNPNVDQARLKRTLDFYIDDRRVPDTQSHESSETDPGIAEGAKILAEATEQKFKDDLTVFNAIDTNGKDVTAEEASVYFQKGLELLGKEDSAWKEWKLVISDGSAGLSSNARKKVVEMGRKRKDFEPLEVKAKFMHEFLVHSQRAINGAKLGDQMMEFGLPNFLGGEEGITTLIELGVLGEPGPARTDKYCDFAFALGMLGDKPVSRPELHSIYVDRAIVRKQAVGEEVDEDKIKALGWKSVNRMYKGSLGNEVVGVNTVDLAYHNGFIKVGKFVKDALESGKRPSELLDYLLKGKFDPTNPRHVEYVDAF